MGTYIYVDYFFINTLIIFFTANENQHTHKIITNTRGILFYSVPHNGSPLANIKLPLFKRSIELQELVNGIVHNIVNV